MGKAMLGRAWSPSWSADRKAGWLGLLRDSRVETSRATTQQAHS